MNNKIYIGIGGVARSGKNLFADVLVNNITRDYNLNVEQYSLAHLLKLECKDFIKEKLGLDVFTGDSAQKAVFRDMLVWFGQVKREQTNGRYWIEHLNKRIHENLTSQVVIITDIRYDHYKNDEVSYIKDELKGTLIHLSKYNIKANSDGSDSTRMFTAPANLHELINDPKIKAKSDIQIEWRDVSMGTQLEYDDLLKHEYINATVNSVIDSLSPQFRCL